MNNLELLKIIQRAEIVEITFHMYVLNIVINEIGDAKKLKLWALQFLTTRRRYAPHEMAMTNINRI